MLSDKDVIPGLHENLFRVVQALQKNFQLKSECKDLILKKNRPKFILTKKMVNIDNKDFLLTTNICNNPTNNAFLVSKKQNPEGKSDADPDAKAIKKKNK